jgi:hypothetical protein
MKCDSQASFLVCTFVNPYLGHEPKVKVATKLLTSKGGLEVIDPTTQANTLFTCLLISDAPANSLKDPNVGFKAKQ